MSESNNKQPPKQFNVGGLLTNDSYIIPMYQRNYAWEEGEITQLIQDVVDYQKEHPNSPYYIGTLVVHRREDGKYETIDGQQRLTTLTLLAAGLKKQKVDVINFKWPEQPNITFENRENSRLTFEAIFKETPNNIAKDSINPALFNGYQIIERELPKLLKQHHVDRAAFATYLLNNVQIMRVEVPHDTDLNHYFEIMNSRGEQLEKHEVLKANLLSVLENGIDDVEEKAKSKACLYLIWEACANMERYVQAGFSLEQRNAVFGAKDWCSLSAKSFDDLVTKLNPTQKSGGAEYKADPDFQSPTLSEIINSSIAPDDKEKEKNEDAPQRFNSVINFPNFLLQVLRIYLNALKCGSSSTSIVEVPLDDKRLLGIFQEHLLQGDQNNVERVKRFAFALLRCKYLYDHYVIKREFIKDKDGWSLKRYKWNDSNKAASYVNTFGAEEESSAENRTVLMLLAAFHVSTPSQAYKHWLSGAVNWLYQQNQPIRVESYRSALELLAKAFMRDRFLVTTDKKEYSEIIYANQGQPKSDCPDYKTMVECLSYGEIENNFVFNYLDYLLWKQKKDARITNFEFTFRSSVEHFYPQHPFDGHPKWREEPLNAFGNLCLISHSKNSRLSNNTPQAKRDHYAQGLIDSIKQYLMMKAMEKGNRWSQDTMWEHQNEMVDVIITALAG